MPTPYTTPGEVQLVGELPAGTAFLINQAYLVTADDGTAGTGGSAVTLGIRVWNGTAWRIATLLNATTGGAGSVTLAGDVSGPSGSNVVVSLTGNGGLLTVIAPTAAWAGNVTTPTLRQSPPAGAGNGQPLSIIAQSGGTGTSIGGALNLSTGAGNGGGLAGAVNIQWAGATQFSFDPAASGLVLSQPNITFSSTAAAPLIQQLTLAATNGKDFTIAAQAGGGGTATTGGGFNFATGAGNAGGAPGTYLFRIGGVASAELIQFARTGGIVFSGAFPTPTIQQQSTSGTPTNMIISAQTTSLAATQGASLQLRSGAGTTGSGFIQLFMGANGQPSFQVNPAGSWNIRSGPTATTHDWFVDWENLAPGQSVTGIDPIGIPVEVDGNPYMIPLYPQ